MERQSSYRESDSKARYSRPQDMSYAAYWPTCPVQGGGEAMSFSYSDTSTNSRFSTYSEGTSLTIPSPVSSPNMAPDNVLSWEEGFASPYMQSSARSTLGEPSSHTSTLFPHYDRHRSLRNTPRSLNWPHNMDLTNLYAFVVINGREPFLNRLPACPPSSSMPQKVFLDSDPEPKKGCYPCQFPGDCTSTFKRQADLDRHYKHVHHGADATSHYRCDRAHCNRASDPFTRMDHYRDHLRDYHKEDIGTAKGKKKVSADEWARRERAFREERVIDPRWWRCAKCCKKNIVDRDGWSCYGCGTECEPERVEARLRGFQKTEMEGTTSDFETQSGACPYCNDSFTESCGFCSTSVSQTEQADFSLTASTEDYETSYPMTPYNVSYSNF